MGYKAVTGATSVSGPLETATRYINAPKKPRIPIARLSEKPGILNCTWNFREISTTSPTRIPPKT